MNKKKTYQTFHRTITEITIGDKFVTIGGNIIEFIGLTNKDDEDKYFNIRYPFEFKIFSDIHDYTENYSMSLTYYYPYEGVNHMLDIASRYATIKDKLNQL
jgi:hypothetical protein